MRKKKKRKEKIKRKEENKEKRRKIVKESQSIVIHVGVNSRDKEIGKSIP